MERKLSCADYFIILQNRFPRENIKNPNVNVRARPDVTILGYGISFPPESQLAYHIYYVKYENTLTCIRISWDWGGE